ncbi:MAG: glycosyltransferase family 9 protein [Bacteriovoracaceae bacterium]
MQRIFFRNIAPKRVLLVKTDLIGDFFLWLPYAKELCHFYHKQGYEITILAHPSWSALIKENLICHEILEADEKSFFSNRTKRIQTFTALSLGFETVVNCHYSNSFMSHYLSVFPSSKNRVGLKGDHTNIHPKLNRLFNRFYHKLYEDHETFDSEQLKQQSLCESIISDFSLEPNSNDTQKENSNSIVFFIGGSNPKRRYPIEKINEIAKSLYEKTNKEILFCGGPDELPLKDKISKEFPNKNLVGDTTLHELIEIIKNAELLISNETGAVHIANFYQTPCVTLLGGGHYKRFLPFHDEQSLKLSRAVIHEMPCFQCNWQCSVEHPLESPYPCIEKIDMNEVLKNAEELLKTS